MFFSSLQSDSANSKEIKNSQKNQEVAILAGGCFWGVQHLFDELEGVVKSEVGYTGGEVKNPTYELVSTGITNHAEAIKITFNKDKISYEKLLKFFFTIHDPTTLNRQQNDVGSQYRSEIFYTNLQQKDIANEVIKQGNASKVFKKPIVTKVTKATEFWSAEEYHQNYLKKNPFGYTCHVVREEWKF